MKTKLDKADIEFSKYVRVRDGKCVRCGRRGEKNAEGLPIIGLQCSHFLSRWRENTRFDPENADSLCQNCHSFWGVNGKQEYRDFKIKQLGQDAFNLLLIRGRMYKKKDRKSALIQAKMLLEELH